MAIYRGVEDVGCGALLVAIHQVGQAGEAHGEEGGPKQGDEKKESPEGRDDRSLPQALGRPIVVVRQHAACRLSIWRRTEFAAGIFAWRFRVGQAIPSAGR